MENNHSNTHFRLMSFAFFFRDTFIPRRIVIEETGVKRGMKVLDFGCGPGGYIPDISSSVGSEGEIYALDIHPLAIRSVKRVIERKGLKNVRIIRSYKEIDLPDSSVDMVLIYDTFHQLKEPDFILNEFHRILKNSGILSFSDHHMTEEEIIGSVEQNGFFRFQNEGKKTYSFINLTD